MSQILLYPFLLEQLSGSEGRLISPYQNICYWTWSRNSKSTHEKHAECNRLRPAFYWFRIFGGWRGALWIPRFVARCHSIFRIIGQSLRSVCAYCPKSVYWSGSVGKVGLVCGSVRNIKPCAPDWRRACSLVALLEISNMWYPEQENVKHSRSGLICYKPPEHTTLNKSLPKFHSTRSSVLVHSRSSRDAWHCHVASYFWVVLGVEAQRQCLCSISIWEMPPKIERRIFRCWTLPHCVFYRRRLNGSSCFASSR